MADLNQHTFYFIRYPLGGGGVHLANLISTSDQFYPRVIGTNHLEYLSQLLKVYQETSKITAHLPGQYIISDIDPWENLLNNIDPAIPNSIHLGHAASFIWSKPILDTLKIKKYILLTANTDRSLHILQTREKHIFGHSVFDSPYYKQELLAFYNQWFYEPGAIDDDINFPIEIEDLFQDNITNLLDRISKKFNLIIPHHPAQELHHVWIQRNQLVL